MAPEIENLKKHLELNYRSWISGDDDLTTEKGIVNTASMVLDRLHSDFSDAICELERGGRDP